MKIPIAINLKAYSKALDRYKRDFLEYLHRKNTKAFDVKDLKSRLEEALGESDISDPSVHQRLMGVREYRLAMDLKDWQDAQDPETPRKDRESLESSLRETQRLTHEAMKDAGREIQRAAKRVPTWHGTSIMVSPLISKSTELHEPVTSVSVKMGRHNLGFTLFRDEDSGQSTVEDLLEVGDTDFFKSPEETQDYYNLVQEIRQPGSTQVGKDVVLYTARPLRDRSLLEGAREVPSNLFWTTSPEAAIGLAHELGGREVRDVYRATINSRYLLMTLDRGRYKEYQTVGQGSVPVRNMRLVEEGHALTARLHRLASKVVEASEKLFIGYSDKRPKPVIVNEFQIMYGAGTGGNPTLSPWVNKLLFGGGTFPKLLAKHEFFDQLYDAWGDMPNERESRPFNGLDYEFKGPLKDEDVTKWVRGAFIKALAPIIAEISGPHIVKLRTALSAPQNVDDVPEYKVKVGNPKTSFRFQADGLWVTFTMPLTLDLTHSELSSFQQSRLLHSLQFEADYNLLGIEQEIASFGVSYFSSVDSEIEVIHESGSRFLLLCIIKVTDVFE